MKRIFWIAVLVAQTWGALAATVTVSDTPGILTALSTASGGDTILLAPGNYAGLAINARNFTSYVTIKSQNTANRAVFPVLYVVNSTYIRLQSIVVHHPMVAGDYEFTRACEVNGSNFVELLDSEFYGSADGNDGNDCYGVGMYSTNNLRVENCDFHDWTRGLILGGGDNFTVRHNNFHQIRSDGCDIADVVGCLVENNTFNNFSNFGEDHPDGIQFFNDGGHRIMRDVVIRGNVILQGSGAPYQSIFIQSNTPAYRNANFLIEYNVVYNGIIHGISVADTDGVTIRHNTVLQSHNPAGNAGTPGIYTFNSTGVVASDNVATAFGISGGTETNNILAVRVNPALPNHYDNLFMNPQAGAVATVDDFRPRPGSILIVNPGPDIGALEFVNNPSVLTAYILTNVSQGGAALTVHFDGSLSAGPAGTITDWHWVFDDGSSAHGAIIDHTYANPGTFHATLTVTNSLNQTATANKTILVTDPPVVGLVYGLNLDGHILDSSAAHINSGWAGTAAFTPSLDGQAASFNGQPLNAGGNAIFAENHANLYGMANLSVALWVKKNQAGSTGRLLWNHIRYGLALAGSTTVEFSAWPGGVTTRPQANVPALGDTNWHHLAMVYNGSTLTGYVDGVAVSQTTGVSGIIDYYAGYNLGVGADPFGAAFDGQLDNVRVYNIALTAAEIANLMQITPATLTATVVAATQIDLAWIHTAHTEAGFEIERKTGAGGTFAPLATTAANATAFSDTTVAAGTEYFYRVRAVNGASASAFSNLASATTPQVNHAPVCASTPTATPNPALVNQAVTFSVVASDADGDALSFIWSFGDGAPSQSGASVTRSFSTAGAYTATVVISDGQAQLTCGPLSVKVVEKSAPPTGNGNGNGGGNTGGGGKKPKALTVTKLLGNVRFDVAGKDNASCSGTLPELPADFSPSGATVVVDLGGATANFTLNAKGAAKSLAGTFALILPRGKKKSAAAGIGFKVTLRNGAWAAALADENLTATGAARTTLTVSLDLDGETHATDVMVGYGVKKGTGKFRK